MAKDSAAKKEKEKEGNSPKANGSGEKAKKPILLIALVLINLLAVVGVGAIVYTCTKYSQRTPRYWW